MAREAVAVAREAEYVVAVRVVTSAVAMVAAEMEVALEVD